MKRFIFFPVYILVLSITVSPCYARSQARPYSNEPVLQPQKPAETAEAKRQAEVQVQKPPQTSETFLAVQTPIQKAAGRAGIPIVTASPQPPLIIAPSTVKTARVPGRAGGSASAKNPKNPKADSGNLKLMGEEDIPSQIDAFAGQIEKLPDVDGSGTADDADQAIVLAGYDLVFAHPNQISPYARSVLDLARDNRIDMVDYWFARDTINQAIERQRLLKEIQAFAGRIQNLPDVDGDGTPGKGDILAVREGYALVIAHPDLLTQDLFNVFDLDHSLAVNDDDRVRAEGLIEASFGFPTADEDLFLTSSALFSFNHEAVFDYQSETHEYEIYAERAGVAVVTLAFDVGCQNEGIAHCDSGLPYRTYRSFKIRIVPDGSGHLPPAMINAQFEVQEEIVVSVGQSLRIYNLPGNAEIFEIREIVYPENAGDDLNRLLQKQHSAGAEIHLLQESFDACSGTNPEVCQGEVFYAVLESGTVRLFHAQLERYDHHHPELPPNLQETIYFDFQSTQETEAFVFTGAWIEIAASGLPNPSFQPAGTSGPAAFFIDGTGALQTADIFRYLASSGTPVTVKMASPSLMEGRIVLQPVTVDDLTMEQFFPAGDLSGDRAVTADDAILVMQHVNALKAGNPSPLTEAQQARGDVDRDGKSTFADARIITMLADGLLTPAELPVVYGDVSRNRRLTAMDAAYVLEHVDNVKKGGPGTLSAVRLAFADMDGDREVTWVDARLILLITVELAGMSDLPIVYGDLNQDGVLDFSDAALLQEHVDNRSAGGDGTLDSRQMNLADFTGDNQPTQADVERMLQLIRGEISVRDLPIA